MDVNRSVLIIRILKSGQGIETTAFLNEAEAGDAVCYSKASLSDSELTRLCDEAGKVVSMMAYPSQAHPRLLADMQRVGRSLFEIFVSQDIGKILKDRGINYLALSVDEQLIHIPWEILHDGEEFLCLRYAVGIIPGARQERFEIEEKNTSKMLQALVMAPSSSYSGLTYHEGVAVINKLYLRRDAIKSMLKVMEIDLKFANENIGKPDIVHFLGQANYDTYDNSRSGWRFTGGIFSTGSIRDLGRGPSVPSFVFADTMQSGKQEEWPLCNFFRPEGFAIANAFLLAGTPNYAETFWMVPDEVRLLFVKEFYGFSMEGFPLGEALRLARLKIVEAYGKSSLFWVNCRLYGNPAISLFEKERLLSVPIENDISIKNEARLLLSNTRKIKRAVVFTCLFILVLLAVRSVVNLLYALELLHPDFEKGLKYVSSQKKAGALARNEPIEDLLYLEKIGAGQDLTESAGASGILNGLTLLAEKEYFDLLIKDALRNISKPEKVGRAETYLHRGDYGKAGIYAEKALRLVGKTGDMAALSKATALLARVYIGENRIYKAHKVVMDSEKIFRKNSYGRGIADSSFIMGIIYALPKHFNEKKSAYYSDMAAHAYLSLGDGSNAARACLISGYTHLMAKSYAKAVKSMAEGLDIIAKFPDNNRKAMAYKALGDAYFASEKYVLARAFYGKAIFLNKRSDSRINIKTYGDILHRMTLYELSRGDLDKALEYCGEIDTFKARVGRNVSTNSHNNIYGIVKSLSGKKNISASELSGIYFNMAFACFKLGYVEEANVFIDRCIKYRAARER